MPIIAIDVETTGLGHNSRPPRVDAVIQIGMAWREKESIKRWSSYCNPGQHFLADGRADKALSVNKITEETVLSAPLVESVAQQFWKTVFELESSGDHVLFCAFNQAFDSGFLSTDPWCIPEKRWGDCIMLDAQNHLHSYKWPRLDEAVVKMGLNWPEGPAHDAAVDAHAALLVHEQIRHCQTESKTQVKSF